MNQSRVSTTVVISRHSSITIAEKKANFPYQKHEKQKYGNRIYSITDSSRGTTVRGTGTVVGTAAGTAETAALIVKSSC